MLSYVNYTQHLCLLTIWISRQQNCAYRTYQFLEEIIFQLVCTFVHTNTPLKQKNTRLLMAFFNQRQFVLALVFPACKAHLFYAALYYHGCPVWLFHIFPHYLIKGSIFGKTLLNIKCVFWVSLIFTSETFFILRIIQRDIINAHSSSHKARHSCQIFIKHFLEKISNMKIRQVEAELFHADKKTWRS